MHMSDSEALERFLQTDPRDVGCDRAMELLHIYAELVAADGSAAARYPGIAAHLRACGPCNEDFEGLLTLVAAPERTRDDDAVPRSARHSWRTRFRRR